MIGAEAEGFAAEEGRAAEEGDRVTIDFKGTVDGVAFERGSGENLQLVIGNAGFIPGFEEGIKGAKKGESRDVPATFPAEYPVAELAGKDAVFAITVKEVERPVKSEITDEFAKTLGLESLQDLKNLVSAQLKRELDQASRMKIKRELLQREMIARQQAMAAEQQGQAKPASGTQGSGNRTQLSPNANVSDIASGIRA